MVASKSLILFDPKVQLLANYLLTGGSPELVPIPDIELGVRYPEAERLLGDDPVAVRSWLEDLVARGILQQRFVGKRILCPKCGSSNTPVNYSCPNCKSMQIDKKLLFEHLACGVIDKEDNFKKGDSLVCPRCGVALGDFGVTHKAVGTWFLCRNCMKAFDKPLSYHVCAKCKQFFVVEDAVLADVYAYRLTKDVEDQLRSGGLFLKPLKDLLERLGYDVEVSGVLRGSSGTDHHFDLIGSKEENAAKETVVLDVVASDGPVEVSAVTNLFAKRYDCNPTRTILVAIPTIVDNGKKLAALYKIITVEAGSAPEAVDKLKRELEHAS